MKSATERTAEAFCALTLTKPEWTHWAHLRVGLWHVLYHTQDAALELLRERIRALNERHGVANTPTGGYHETITRFYVRYIGVFVEAAGRDLPIDALAMQLILKHGAKELPLRYWTKERLMSAEARLGWIEPDLRPIGLAID